MNEANAEPRVLEHDYDGIREYDNRLPNWWLITLYGAIVFAALYWAYYHGFGIGLTSAEALSVEMQEADAALAKREAAEEEKNPLTAARLVAMAADAETVARGKEVFATSCLACHGAKGEGLVGPNLTDEFWIHDPAPLKMLALVEDGIVAKGMPAWKPILGATKTREVTAYVLTLIGTNVPGKAPQGEKGVAPDNG